MGKDDINVIELKVLETLEETFDNVFSGQSTSVVSLFSVGTEEDLGGDDVISSVLGSGQSSTSGERSRCPM